jgi:hypothetical protein
MYPETLYPAMLVAQKGTPTKTLLVEPGLNTALKAKEWLPS